MELFGQSASLPTCRANGSLTNEVASWDAEKREENNDWLLWQLADSAFPAGGFAHSSGLEAASQHGELPDRAALAGFIGASLCQVGRGMLPLMTGVYDDPGRLIELDRLCDSFTINHVANRASRLQGRALLSSARRIFGDLSHAKLPSGHLAPVFGAVAAHLHLDRNQAARLFLFVHLRGLIASAVRLGLVGPLEAQALQHRLAAEAEEILQRCKNLPTNEIAQTAPLLDLWQGAQDRLYSRLFQS